MANSIETTNFRAQDYVPQTSRYINSTIIYYGENNLLTFETYKKQVIASDSSDKFATIPAGMEYRPDLVSRQTYGTPDFWWKIMEANNISDVFDFKAGLNIRLPGKVY